ncbi:Nuclear transport factor 2 family protein with RNA binding domain isoform 1 [Tripterygium wilfordii]|uniref:Nuclear transport factor 2 family protein with RNA binding domain isoform 1 n=1 Tax=Tripterygium wilfordii TaxID=458696 RepID=A0A7J7CND4_TRIWF|nr:nuclear transport factor 2-like isoform X2 [Tripterygium wilfordii]KAF5735602.1 Nuclear transport factor 2 family protein with RNA binding domain isoform 1 [Tripterygium wilfordii]
MALQNETRQATPTAQVVGNAFVEQYYHILHHSPGLVYKFYQDSSVVSRPDPHGAMTSVTTMQGINEKILSLNYTDFKAEIKTADAQKSYMEGVTVLVTGCLTGKDNLRRKFAQSFFLAPQDNGFFVLNDVFRYVEDSEPLESQPVNHTDNFHALRPISDPVSVPDPPAPDPATSIVFEDIHIAEKSYDPSEHEIQVATEDEAVVDSQPDSNGSDVVVVVESASAQEDAPKKSYASIVKVAKGGLGTTKIYVPTNTAKVAPKKAENQSVVPVVPAPEVEPSAPIESDNPESSNAHEDVEDHSIYVRNLPLNMTVAQMEVEFKKFGPIKDGGVQVRNNKTEGYCFGFVEFHSLSSMSNAIQASPINIGGRQAFVERKKARTRGGGGSGRGRFPSGRGGFRNDSFRARGIYGSTRGFGWSEVGNRNEFSGRGRGLGGRGEGYQGRGRSGRSSAPKLNTTTT